MSATRVSAVGSSITGDSHAGTAGAVSLAPGRLLKASSTFNRAPSSLETTLRVVIMRCWACFVDGLK
jgi:hypothetical protein